MNATTTPNSALSTTTTPPVLSTDVMRRLPLIAAGTVAGVALVTVALGLVVNRDAWWPALVAAFVVAAVGAAASVAVLNVGRGKTVDWLVTLTMAATLARMAVSGAGILIAIKLLGTLPEVTAFSVCGYYVAMLVAETALLTRAAAMPRVGESHA